MIFVIVYVPFRTNHIAYVVVVEAYRTGINYADGVIAMEAGGSAPVSRLPPPVTIW